MKLPKFVYSCVSEAKSCLAKTLWTPEKVAGASERLLKKIKAKMRPNTVAILTGMGIGDMLYAMGFVNAYLAKHPGRKALIVARAEHREIVRSYGNFDFFPITKWNAGAYSSLLHSNRWESAENSNVICTYWLPDCGKENMVDKMRWLYQIEESTPIQFHNLKPEKVVSIPDFYHNCNKIVVINPFSNSCRLPREAVDALERLAWHLENDGNAGGYTVYTNVIKDQRPIPGTKELRCGLAELLEIAAHIPLIVSVRSGILDFVVKTNGNMLVLYEDDGIGRDRYSLKAWNCSGAIKEVTFSEFLDSSIPEQTAQFLDEITKKAKRV